MDEQKIIFSNRFEKEKFEDYKTDLGTDSSVTPDFTEADDFLKFIQKNRRSVPSKERIADKDKFIKTVYELSNSFEIDADLIEFAEGYIANIYVDYACYWIYNKKVDKYDKIEDRKRRNKKCLQKIRNTPRNISKQ